MLIELPMMSEIIEQSSNYSVRVALGYRVDSGAIRQTAFASGYIKAKADNEIIKSIYELERQFRMNPSLDIVGLEVKLHDGWHFFNTFGIDSKVSPAPRLRAHLFNKSYHVEVDLR